MGYSWDIHSGDLSKKHYVMNRGSEHGVIIMDESWVENGLIIGMLTWELYTPIYGSLNREHEE